MTKNGNLKNISSVLVTIKNTNFDLKCSFFSIIQKPNADLIQTSDEQGATGMKMLSQSSMFCFAHVK